MRIHPVRTALAVVALAEVGALAGALLVLAFLAGWARLRYGPLPSQAVLGALVWAGTTGAPLGAVLLPALGLTALRAVPLGRALGYPLAGALLGLTAAALVAGGPAALPVPLLVPALGVGGLLAGVGAARRAVSSRALPGSPTRLGVPRRRT